MTLKAKWAVKKFTVTFDINEGTGDVAAQTVEYGAKATAPETNPTLVGSNFIAWTTTKDDAETTFDFDTVIKSDVTLYAYYSADPYYTVKFMNGETVVATKSVKEGTKTTAPEDVVKKGYTFEGWFADTTKFDAEAAVTANATYTAKLTLDTYTITYVLDDGTNYEGAPTSYTVESEKINFGDAEKEGYVFDGWFSDEEFTTQVLLIEKGSVGNITLYAKYTKAAAGNGTSKDDLAPITKTTIALTDVGDGAYEIFYQGLSDEIHIGDRIRYDVTISDISNFKQFAIQSAEDNMGWNNASWTGGGVAEGVLGFVRTATKDLSAGEHYFKVHVDNLVDGKTVPEQVTLSITVKNYGPADEGLVYEALGKTASTIELPKNYAWGKPQTDENLECFQNSVSVPLQIEIKKDSEYKIIAKGKCNIDCAALKLKIVDISKDANYWGVISAEEKLFENCVADEDFDVEITLKATGDSKGTTNILCLAVGKDVQVEVPTFTFDTFKVIDVTPAAE